MRYLFIERNAVTSTPTLTRVNNLNESTDASKNARKWPIPEAYTPKIGSISAASPQLM